MDLAAVIAVALLIPVSSWRAALKQKGLKTKGRLLQPRLQPKLSTNLQMSHEKMTLRI